MLCSAASAEFSAVFTTTDDHPLAALTCGDTPRRPVYSCRTSGIERVQVNGVDGKEVLADRMTDHWTSFAHTGDPNNPGRPAWPQYSGTTRQNLTLDDEMPVLGGYHEHKCALMDALPPCGRRPGRKAGYVQAFKCFDRLLEARKAAESEAVFGVRLVCPVDEFNASRHVGDESAALLLPPTVQRVTEFFDFLKVRIATSRKACPGGPDYAMFRTLHHAGLRADESYQLDQSVVPGSGLRRTATRRCGGRTRRWI